MEDEIGWVEGYMRPTNMRMRHAKLGSFRGSSLRVSCAIYVHPHRNRSNPKVAFDILFEALIQTKENERQAHVIYHVKSFSKLHKYSPRFSDDRHSGRWCLGFRDILALTLLDCIDRGQNCTMCLLRLAGVLVAYGLRENVLEFPYGSRCVYFLAHV